MAKFLVIHPNVDIYGGGERVCHHILKTLVVNGQQVELLAFNFDIAYYKKIMGEKLPDEVNITILGDRKIVEANPPFSVYKRRQNIINILKKYKKTAKYDCAFCTQTISSFETSLFDAAKKNIAYVHFPEIHYTYEHYGILNKLYFWPYKKILERSLSKLNLLFCNSNYTKIMAQKYWGRFVMFNPVVVYPPVEDYFWLNKYNSDRLNRVIYTGRFIPQKRHDILKQLAIDLPEIQFVSVGLLRETEKVWYEEFSKNVPDNYDLKPNLSETEKIRLLQTSRIYVHLMEGEHFGIAPIEALVSGCISLVHDSGGSTEFISKNFRWKNYEDLKSKIKTLIKLPNPLEVWERTTQGSNNLSSLKPSNFEEKIWAYTEALIK